MRLKHETRNLPNGFQHRLIDLDDPDRAVQQGWVGYRTPAVWRSMRNEVFGEVESHYAVTTDYFNGSRELPSTERIYYTCGLPKDRADFAGVATGANAQFAMAMAIWDKLEEYLEAIPGLEGPDIWNQMTPQARIKDFVAFLAGSVKFDLPGKKE